MHLLFINSKIKIVMNTIQLDERLSRIEKLLLGTKKVLTFDELVGYTGLSRSYLYKLTASAIIPHSKPNGKVLFFEKEKIDKWLLDNEIKSQQELEEEANLYTSKRKA